jgi:hypothetical protein
MFYFCDELDAITGVSEPVIYPCLTFSSHDLAVFSYDVSEVLMTYAGVSWRPVKRQRARARTAGDAERYPGITGGSYPSFAGALRLRWRARDGDALETLIDLHAIFPDRTILHTELPERIDYSKPLDGEPTIVVEINDRTVNIYMYVTIMLKPIKGTAGLDRNKHGTLAFSVTL